MAMLVGLGKLLEGALRVELAQGSELSRVVGRPQPAQNCTQTHTHSNTHDAHTHTHAIKTRQQPFPQHETRAKAREREKTNLWRTKIPGRLRPGRKLVGRAWAARTGASSSCAPPTPCRRQDTAAVESAHHTSVELFFKAVSAPAYL